MKTDKLTTYIQHLIDTGVTPGASILVGKQGKILLKRNLGFKSLSPKTQLPPSDSRETTIYDLASLTKPLITAFLTVFLVQNNALTLETPVKKIVPDFPFEFNILHLLTHSSGLPAWFPFYLFEENDRNYIKHFHRLNLESKPGENINYSCVGYILLHHIIEKLSGIPFNDFAKKIIFDPLHLKHTFLSLPSSLVENTAPTEDGNLVERGMVMDWAEKSRNRDYIERAIRYTFRNSLIHGKTHDINSHHIGGCSGNSGLFSTPEDILELCKEFYPSTATLLDSDSVSLFWKNFTPFSPVHRSIGFKLNSSTPTSGGIVLSKRTIGHTGFTGTSVMLEPGSETVYIIFTNRIHPVFKPYNFDNVRRKIHRLAIFQLKMEYGDGFNGLIKEDRVDDLKYSDDSGDFYTGMNSHAGKVGSL